MEQSTTAKPAAHLGVALVESLQLQVTESHLSTAHLTLGEDSAKTGLVYILNRQLKTEVGYGKLSVLVSVSVSNSLRLQCASTP